METETIIRAGRRPFWELASEVWNYKDVLSVLVRRQLSVRFKQTVLGVLWVIMQPLVTVTMFSIIFVYFIKIPGDKASYITGTFASLAFWNLFSQGTERSSNSLVQNEGLITKVYFPRLVIPLAAVGATFVDFLVSFFFVLVATISFGFHPTPWSLLIVPFCVFFIIVLASGIGMLFSALNVKHRDFAYIIPFFLQTLMYASPVVYPASVVPALYQNFYFLNPVAVFIHLLRCSLLGEPLLMSFKFLFLAPLIVILVFFVGVSVFRAAERSFADFI